MALPSESRTMTVEHWGGIRNKKVATEQSKSNPESLNVGIHWSSPSESPGRERWTLKKKSGVEWRRVLYLFVHVSNSYARLFTIYQLVSPFFLIQKAGLFYHHDHLDCSNDRWCHPLRLVLSDTDSSTRRNTTTIIWIAPMIACTTIVAPFFLVHMTESSVLFTIYHQSDHLDCSDDRLYLVLVFSFFPPISTPSFVLIRWA